MRADGVVPFAVPGGRWQTLISSPVSVASAASSVFQARRRYFATAAKRLSTRSVRLARMILIQAIRNAMVNDLVVRNVADLAAVPTGEPGRPSRSLNLEQALAVLDAAKGERLWPYVAVSMLGGQS